MVKYFKTLACLCLLVVLGVPAVSAWSTGQSWSDNPEHISAMQAYVAYSGEQYNAKMAGAIQYINGLNGTTTSGTLQTDEQQFISTVASVQNITTSDAITQAEQTEKTQIAQFRTDLVAAYTADNGNLNDLRAAVNSSVSADQSTIQSLESTYWTASEKSRLDEFTYYDGYRTSTLANLTAKGVDVTSAQLIETQIQALEPSLKVALDSHNDAQIDDVNRQLGSLSSQFWTAVSSLDWQAREKSRLSWFDNRTAQMQSDIANLSAQHIDTSQAESVLDQFQAQRDPLKAAYDNHDQQNLDTLITQLNTLSKQFYDLTHGDVWWQAHETAALGQFDNTTAKMNDQLANLSAKGEDVTQAQGILDQIVAERPSLKAAYDNQDSTALKTVDAQLKDYYSQYTAAVKTINGLQAQETKRLAEFDKNVASWQSTLATLKSNGVDVSQAEGILDQISAERTPLVTAYTNDDSSALDSINAQLKTLDSQLETLIKGYEHPLSGNGTVTTNPTHNGNRTHSSSSAVGAVI
jgi:hypothetical protein